MAVPTSVSGGKKIGSFRQDQKYGQKRRYDRRTAVGCMAAAEQTEAEGMLFHQYGKEGLEGTVKICKETLEQIEGWKYAEGVKRCGMKQVIRYKIAFRGKECMV